ncbi:tetratricopeptide repeat protein [Streptomyces sp. NPDC001552]|uniref:tetratricopeptide repeat protein n=1 Tax=Streptomyces sp. NPDC001552 TaxID=3364587 RepID=UPI0036BABB52
MLQHLITHGEDSRMVPTDHDQLTTAVEKIREELQALPEGADIARARVLARWTGVGLLSLGHHDDARVFLRQALDLAEASGDSRAVIATELNLADAYRYAGEADNADVLYRRALDGARGQHPELVDFALQHLGKHLMEQGSLTPARAHLREALRLRTAKGDAGLQGRRRADRIHPGRSRPRRTADQPRKRRYGRVRGWRGRSGTVEQAMDLMAPIPHHGPDVGSAGGRVSSSPGRRTRSHRARAGAAPPPA